MIRRSVKPGVTHEDSAAQRDAERLDRAIQILVMDGVFVVPNPGHRARHLPDDEGTAIDSRLGLDRATGRSRPGTCGGGHSYRWLTRNALKGKIGRASDIVTTIGGIVIHVALPRVSLTPGVLVPAVILDFEVIRRASVQRCIQIGRVNEKPMRCGGMSVARVILGPGIYGKGAGKRIDPRARTQGARVRVALEGILTRRVGIGASLAKFSLISEGSAAKAASVFLVCPECMLRPGLPNLFKAIVVARPAAHPVEILRHDRMVSR